MTDSINALQQRVVTACNAVLKRNGSVGLIELCQQLSFLQQVHVDNWKHGKLDNVPLIKLLQVGADKFQKVLKHYEDWALSRGMSTIQVAYERQGRNGPERLPILIDDNPDQDALWRRHFVPADLSAKKAEKLEQKLNKPDDIAVFSQTTNKEKCAECSAEMLQGDLFFQEQNQIICLSCADLDHLEYLPSGDATLTRRARKFSPLVAEVLQFNRRRKRHERIGLLVTAEAIDQAEISMDEDASERAVQRHKAAQTRQKQDAKLVDEMTAQIVAMFPNCSADEAHQIAAHTAVRGSGRVGRSERGRNLDDKAIELAVIAWIRHQHTDYDALLMRGVPRRSAREQIRATVQKQLANWRAGA